MPFWLEHGYRSDCLMPVPMRCRDPAFYWRQFPGMSDLSQRRGKASRHGLLHQPIDHTKIPSPPASCHPRNAGPSPLPWALGKHVSRNRDPVPWVFFALVTLASGHN